jgi:hypothetical protein
MKGDACSSGMAVADPSYGARTLPAWRRGQPEALACATLPVRGRGRPGVLVSAAPARHSGAACNTQKF